MIKHVATSAIALALLAVPGLATAADATGTVRSWNEQNRQLILDNGQTYILNQNVSLTGVQIAPGQRVTLTFDAQGNQNMVTRIVPAAGAATPGAAPGNMERDAVEGPAGVGGAGAGVGAPAGGAAR